MPPEPTAKRASAGGPAIDRLSTLPDGLLHAVLSFLPAPQVVRTCVLSRRWRDLWRSAPCINIDQQEFGIAVGDSRDVLEEKWGKFEDFTTNLLLFRDNTSSLDKFRLCAHGHYQRDVDRWIRRGIKYCPAVVEIEILRCDLGFKLPPLRSSFCRLERLRLYNLSLDSNFAELLCSGCLVLEDLELKICDNYFQGITSPTLKKLVIDCCSNYTSHPLVITAPSLTYLSLRYYQNGISVDKMASLVKASIHITESQTFPLKTQRSLLGSLFNVTSLELWGFEAVVMLNEKSDRFPIFRNMQTLYLGSCFLHGFYLNDKLEALGSFLENAPCLEKLTLWCCMFMPFSDSEWHIERKSITLQRQDGKTFQCHKLKLIEVIYDYDRDHQLTEFLWGLGRSLPDASIKLTKI